MPGAEASTLRAALLLTLVLVLPTVAAQTVPTTEVVDLLFPQPPQDDCDTGADAAHEPGEGARLVAPFDCAGTMTRRDQADAYVFAAEKGQYVELLFDPDPSYPYLEMQVRGPAGEGESFPVNYPDMPVWFVMKETGDVEVRLWWSADRNIEFDYRMRARVVGETAADPQNDCGSGAGGGNDHASATPIQVPVSCTGTLRGADAWDYYRFPVLLGQEIDVDLDVRSADHEICLFPPTSYRAVACSTRDWGQDEEIRWTDAHVRGDWRVAVYRYSGDDDYGLSVNVHGEPSNEAPGVAIACPHTVDAGVAFTCTLHGADFDSDHLRFFVRWNNGPEQVYPAEGTVAPGEPVELVHTHHTPGRNLWISVTVRDDEGGESWNAQLVFVRGLKPPQQDCGTDGDAGDSFETATPLALPRVACETSLTASLQADETDWYAVEMQAGETLVARLDVPESYEVPRLCAYTPSGQRVACTSSWDPELAVPVDTTGTWRLVTYAGTLDHTALLSVSMLATVTHGVQVVPGYADELLPTPLPAEAAPLEGVWVDLPESETGERGLRANGSFRARFYDAAGELLEEVSAYGGVRYPWVPVPQAAARVLVDHESSLAPWFLEVAVYH